MVKFTPLLKHRKTNLMDIYFDEIVKRYDKVEP
jgi:hypothetical protein